MNAIAQNNRYGTIAKIEGTLMEFATEDEAVEYAEEHSFSKILEHEMEEVKRGNNIYIR